MGLHRAQGSYKEILKKAVDGYPFGSPDYQNGSATSYFAAVKKIYDEQKAKLDEAWGESKKSKWEIAKIMHEICVTGAYMAYDDKRRKLDDEWVKANPGSSWKDSPYAVIGGFAGISNPINLITFAKQEYGICRTDLYNMLAVIEEFGNEQGNMIGDARIFTFYQLVEMLPLTYAQRKKVQPNWTIAEIKAYKKSLNSVQTSGHENDEPEEPEEPVNDRYKRFEKLTRVDLCERIIELEEEILELQGTL